MRSGTQQSLDLDAGKSCVDFTLAHAEVRLWPDWLETGAADAWMLDLLHEIAFEQHQLHMFGRLVDTPRLSCWIGDADAGYRYSGTRFEPHPWTPALLELRKRVEAACEASFNSVLANLYRGGHDSMGWHSDNEPELGPEPVIASVSLGATRRFRLRQRADHASARTLELTHGSLLRMAGATQRHWQHAVPRTRLSVGARLNLTFRRIR